jgi:hypothetical protein
MDSDDWGQNAGLGSDDADLRSNDAGCAGRGAEGHGREQALPQNMTPARSGIGLTVRRKPLTKPQLQNFSRTQEVHPLWVREILHSV